MTNDSEPNTVIVRRRIAATREEIFDAWLDPEGMREWMCPGDIVEADVRLDPKVGGSLLILMKSLTETHEHRGEFRVIDRPTKLVFTWTAKSMDGELTLVTIDLHQISDDETDLILTHERIPRPEVRESYQGGWAKIISLLDQHLGCPG